jgi:hypothetical protein
MINPPPRFMADCAFAKLLPPLAPPQSSSQELLCGGAAPDKRVRGGSTERSTERSTELTPKSHAESLNEVLPWGLIPFIFFISSMNHRTF